MQNMTSGPSHTNSKLPLEIASGYETVRSVEESIYSFDDSVHSDVITALSPTSSTGENADNLEAKTFNKASWISCYINLTSTIIGAGVLGVPYAISLTGLIMGLAMLTFCGLFSYFGLHLLSECALKVPLPSSFNSVALKSIPGFASVVDAAITLKGIGIATSYLIVIGDSIPLACRQYVSSGSLLQSRSGCIMLSYVLILPLSYLPSLDELKYSSLFSMIMIFLLMILVILYSTHSNTTQHNGGVLDPCSGATELHCGGTLSLFKFDSSVLKAFPIFLFTFSCQQNTFTVVNELQRPTKSRLSSIFGISIGSAWLVAAIIGCCGYATYGDAVHSDILKSYPGINKYFQFLNDFNQN